MTLETFDVFEQHVTEKVSAALPIDDLLAWLIREYPNAQLEQILSMLKTVYQQNFAISTAGELRKTYQVGDRGFDAYPQRVDLE